MCSPDESGKPFEAELLIFPEKKERQRSSFFILEKSNFAKKLETASRK
jgi:hypothetical protein